jgi:hypothetical protein
MNNISAPGPRVPRNPGVTSANSAVRHTTTGAVIVVAGIAAVVSYSHMQQLADHAGEGWRSWLIPVSIDGLVVAASMVLLARRRAGLAGGWLAWGALAAGVLASLAANMADARPEITAVLVAGWPAAAFAVVFELLLQQRRADRPGQVDRSGPNGQTAPDRRTAPVTVPGITAPVRPGVLLDRTGPTVQPEPPGPVHPLSPVQDRSDSLPDTPVPGTSRTEVTDRTGAKPDRTLTAPPDRSDDELLEEFRRTGRTPSTYALKQTLGVGSSRAARLLTQFDPGPASALSANGQTLKIER